MSTKYEIVTYGNPALKRKTRPVALVNKAIRELARDMLEAMYRANGVGLAAPQVGRDEAICVIDVTPRDEAGYPVPATENAGVAMPLVMVNPEVFRAEGEQRGQEGCLSFPEIFVTLTCAADVTVRYMDLEGREQFVNGVGLLARALLHEIDHLHGVLLVDRMSAVQKLAVSGKLKRLKQENAAQSGSKK